MFSLHFSESETCRNSSHVCVPGIDSSMTPKKNIKFLVGQRQTPVGLDGGRWTELVVAITRRRMGTIPENRMDVRTIR